MPPASKPFPHLPLILRYDGPARFPQLRMTGDPRTKLAQGDRKAHSGSLSGTAATASSAWTLRVNDREQANLPMLPKNVPLVLEVDTALDLDELRKWFGFELVSEQENGFVIVASEDLDLNAFLKKLQDFVGQVAGSAAVARIYKIEDDPDQSKRLSRILSDHLLAIWPALDENEDYVVEVGVACVGQIQIPTRPNEPNRGKIETDKTFAKRQGKHAGLMKVWTDARIAAYMAWDDLSDTRYREVKNVVDFYGGEVLNHFNQTHTETMLADSFTLQIRISGKGLRDLVLNYPFLFEVVEPDDVSLPQTSRASVAKAKEKVTIIPPPANAPAVCIIDSGLQEGHYLLEPAVDREASFCFLPGVSPTDVADYVSPGGHGTRVAGAVLYGEGVPRAGKFKLEYWLQNARVLNGDCAMPERLFPPMLLQELIARYHQGKRATRIFNHSITSTTPCRTRHMSAWAAEIDQLSYVHDVLFVVSSGNIHASGSAAIPGVLQHLTAGRKYPAYLSELSSRVANPAQSLQALTVGSVGYREFEDPDWHSSAREVGHPSAFSRSGLGIWNSIKPEVVEFGGDNLVSRNTPTDVGNPECGRECYPELVRSTMHPPGLRQRRCRNVIRRTEGESHRRTPARGFAGRVVPPLPRVDRAVRALARLDQGRHADRAEQHHQVDRLRRPRHRTGIVEHGVPNDARDQRRPHHQSERLPHLPSPDRPRSSQAGRRLRRARRSHAFLCGRAKADAAKPPPLPVHLARLEEQQSGRATRYVPATGHENGRRE